MFQHNAILYLFTYSVVSGCMFKTCEARLKQINCISFIIVKLWFAVHYSSKFNHLTYKIKLHVIDIEKLTNFWNRCNS